MLEIKTIYADPVANARDTHGSESSENQYNFVGKYEHGPVSDFRQVLDLEQEYEKFIDDVKDASRKQTMIMSNDERVDT